MIALLLAASVAFPPGFQGEWVGDKPGFQLELFRTGLVLDYATPDAEGGVMCEFLTATSQNNAFVVRCGWEMYGDVIINSDGSLTFRGWLLDIDNTILPIEDRFTREGLSDS